MRGGGGDGPEQHPHGATMPTREIRHCIDFLRGESGGGDNNRSWPMWTPRIPATAQFAKEDEMAAAGACIMMHLAFVQCC